MSAPSFAEPILIVSDLHYGHPIGKLNDLKDLGPILAGIKTLIVNGDYTESRLGADLARAREKVELLRSYTHSLDVALVMLEGNHDPGLYGQSWLELADGQIVVTHGDCLYWDIAPWSPEIEPYRQVWQPFRQEWEAACQDSWPRLLAYTEARRKEVRHCGDKFARGPGGKLRSALRLAMKPLRILRMLEVWTTSHLRAEKLVRRLSPRARFFLYGHTHHSVVKKRGDLVLINTGAWQAYASTRIVRVGDGEVRIGKVGWKDGTLEVDWESSHSLALAAKGSPANY